MLRKLLVSGAHYVLGPFGSDSDLSFRLVSRTCRVCLRGAGTGRGSYFDATKVEANASLDFIEPRFAVEEHLDGLFEREPPGEHKAVRWHRSTSFGRYPRRTTRPCWTENAAEETGSPGTGARGGR